MGMMARDGLKSKPTLKETSPEQKRSSKRKYAPQRIPRNGGSKNGGLRLSESVKGLQRKRRFILGTMQNAYSLVAGAVNHHYSHVAMCVYEKRR